MSKIVMQVSGYSSGYTPVADHPGWFLVETLAFDTGSSPDFGSGSGTSRGGRPPHRVVDFEISRVQDALSVALVQLCADGSSVRKLVLELLKDGKMWVRYSFDTVTVTSFSTTGSSSDERPIEWVKFSASSVRAETA